VAKIVPVGPDRPVRLRKIVEAWMSVEADDELARDLEAVGAADAPAQDTWAWSYRSSRRTRRRVSS
jgi:hypothetical protein